MKGKVPSNKEDCFIQLDALLGSKDKQLMKENGCIADYHFTIGMWIRSNWLSPKNEENYKVLSKCFADRDERLKFYLENSIRIHPDDLSMEIIRQYIEYLKKK